MESTPKEDSQKIAFDESVFLPGKQAGKAQCGKGEKVIAAYLERCQYVGTTVLEKLQDAVGKSDSQSGTETVPVAD